MTQLPNISRFAMRLAKTQFAAFAGLPKMQKLPDDFGHKPAPDDIRQAREAAGLTQTKAAQVVRSTLRTWQQWEAGDRSMHAGLWELFHLKTKT